MIRLLAVLFLVGCVQMPNDYRLSESKQYSMWADIQRAVIVCIDGGGYAQLHRGRDGGDAEVKVWCFNE